MNPLSENITWKVVRWSFTNLDSLSPQEQIFEESGKTIFVTVGNKTPAITGINQRQLKLWLYLVFGNIWPITHLDNLECGVIWFLWSPTGPKIDLIWHSKTYVVCLMLIYVAVPLLGNPTATVLLVGKLTITRTTIHSVYFGWFLSAMYFHRRCIKYNEVHAQSTFTIVS